ncbi:MAG: AAA family ATPase [Acidobacteriota bacterium]
MTMTRRDLIFRVFVSSTFSDMVAERNALQENTFTHLRTYCRDRGARFHAVDLRWGVSEEAALDQQTMNICLQELRRCQRLSPRPNFIVLLGERYGWRPLPAQIEAIEFEALLRRIPHHNLLPSWYRHREKTTGRDVRDDSAVPAGVVVHSWYRRDDNAVPARYDLLPREANNDAEDQWKAVEPSLHSLLLAAAKQLFDTGDRRLDKYQDSASHQEIRSALEEPGAQRQVFGYFRTITGLPTDHSARDYRDLINGARDLEAEECLRALKHSLKGDDSQPGLLAHDHVYEYTTNWPVISNEEISTLCARVERDLISIIEREIDEFERGRELDREIRAHWDLGLQRAEHFKGRMAQLEKIDTYIGGDRNCPFLIHGVSGSGKTALMGRVLETVAHQAATATIIARFIGATPASSDGASLLESLCSELGEKYGNEWPVPSGFRELAQEFSSRLRLATAERPLILLLDALDQLSPTDGARDLTWLPHELPPNVKLIVSGIESDGPEGECYRTASRIAGADNLARVDALDVVEREALLDEWLLAAGRSLRPDQRSEVLGKSAVAGLPLYLRLAFGEARRWKSYDPLGALGSDVPGLVEQLLTRLEDERQHGRVLTLRALGLLAASRHGLTEEELLDVLSADPEVLGDFRRRSPRSPLVTRLPVVVWSRLHADVEPHLAERRADATSVLNFYHAAIRKGIVDRLERQGELAGRHAHLVEYFRSQPHHVVDGTAAKRPNYRKCSELPWLLAESCQWPALFALLSDLGFFAAAFQTRKSDVWRYWTQIEATGAGTCVAAYSPVVARPGDHEDELVWNLACFFRARGDAEAAFQLWEHNVERWHNRPGSELMQAVALCGVAQAQAARGDYEGALASYERAEGHSRQTGNAIGLVAALGGRAATLASLNRNQEALGLLREEEPLCRGRGLDRDLLGCLRNQAVLLAALGYLHEAHRRFEEHARLAGALNEPGEKVHALLCEATLAVRANQTNQALQLANQAIGIGEDYGLKPLLDHAAGVVQGIAYHPSRPGPGLDLARPNELDWTQCNERELRDILYAVNEVNLRDRFGRTPLMGAVWHGYFKLMMDLVKRGADVNACDDDGDTALAMALEKHPDRRQVADILIELGARRT